MSILTCIAKLTAKEEYKQTVQSELKKLVLPTRQEAGCISYDMHIDNDNDTVFMFYERWEKEQDLDNHLESSNIKHCFEMIGDMLESVDISRLTKVVG
ncbi:antibiotic biosynthesis monooxygenase [Pseudoalteromonas sp. JBTF-M23]|uniref:Antibiotic biosynthesis monooxygenase n=1 Tax=Pseudoalteromonas caenipelagi TaxID=2726988 RepID=A0A849VGV1_9GAMM|nr:putative quinol monooxygenase [Pseudoalteromonas caenipelagi]NOU52516.1 antibiotic biosynthesis monooxygenase [Pseudoalteromonas caenipelagi]